MGKNAVDLFQEPVDNLLLGFAFRQPQGHELDNLLPGNLADGRLVNQGSVNVVGLQLGNCQNPALPMMMASHSV